MTWSTAAARAVNAGFRTFGRSATYTPAGGDPIAVTVIVKTPEGDLSGIGLGARRIGRVADVRSSEVASPAEGDTLTIGEESFIVRGAAPDAERLAWSLDLDPA